MVTFTAAGVTVSSLSDPENEQITPDDRQQTIEVVGGVVVQDYGHIAAGDKTAWTIVFPSAAWAQIVAWWDARTRVSIVDAAGDVFQARIVVKSYSRVPRFAEKAVAAQIELWAV